MSNSRLSWGQQWSLGTRNTPDNTMVRSSAYNSKVNLISNETYCEDFTVLSFSAPCVFADDEERWCYRTEQWGNTRGTTSLFFLRSIETNHPSLFYSHCAVKQKLLHFRPLDQSKIFSARRYTGRSFFSPPPLSPPSCCCPHWQQAPLFVYVPFTILLTLRLEKTCTPFKQS